MSDPRPAHSSRGARNRGVDASPRDRGSRSHQGRGRGPRPTDLPPVPSRSQIAPGRSVSIVLKADQGTGRTISGVVADVLTAGNHPRGVKVRLQDGRVGRVQAFESNSDSNSALVSATGAQAVTGDQQAVQRLDEPGLGKGPVAGRDVDRAVQDVAESIQRPRYRDIRLDAQLEAPETEYDLFSFVKTKDKKGKKTAAQSATADDDAAARSLAALSLEPDVENAATPSQLTAGSIVQCPVCGTFEGDEAAVSHHVEQDHFG